MNVLVAAFRGDHEHHRPARAWLDRMRAGPRAAPMLLLPVVATSFVRIVGERRVFPTPTGSNEAVRFIEALLAAGDARIAPVPEEWPTFARLCREHALTGGSVTDAWIAAAVIHLDEHLVTFDRGFRRLLPASALTVLDPTAS